MGVVNIAQRLATVSTQCHHGILSVQTWSSNYSQTLLLTKARFLMQWLCFVLHLRLCLLLLLLLLLVDLVSLRFFLTAVTSAGDWMPSGTKRSYVLLVSGAGWPTGIAASDSWEYLRWRCFRSLNNRRFVVFLLWREREIKVSKEETVSSTTTHCFSSVAKMVVEGVVIGEGVGGASADGAGEGEQRASRVPMASCSVFIDSDSLRW